MAKHGNVCSEFWFGTLEEIVFWELQGSVLSYASKHEFLYQNLINKDLPGK